jgi:hypothetical protein
VAIQDLSDLRDPAASGRQDRDPDKGWAELMRLASAFPLEMLSFGGTTASVRLPRPRAVSYDAAIDIADGAGLSLATW